MSIVNEVKYRRDIQVLRGISVLAVVLFHASGNLFPQGYIGVDVFFVISGFVVTPLIVRIFDNYPTSIRLSKLKIFYIRRFYRLAPALAFMLTLSVVLLFLFGDISDHQRFARQGIATLFLSANLGAYHYSGDYFSPNPNPLIHTWSLSVEEQIYILLPILIWSIVHRKKKILKAFCFVYLALTIFSIFSFLFPHLQPIYVLLSTENISLLSFYSPIDRIWQFTLGGFVFLLTNYRKDCINTISNLLSYLIVLSLIIILFFPLDLNFRICSLSVTIVTLLAITFRSLELLPRKIYSTLLWLGDRSYSIYLLHMPIIYVAKYSPYFETNFYYDRSVYTLIAIILTFLIGNLSYLKFEIKYRSKFINNSLKNINSKKAIARFMLLISLFLFVDKTSSMGTFLDRKSQFRNEISPQDWDPDCKFHQPATPRPNSLCYYPTSSATKNYLLIGDSHAGHLSKTIIEIAEENNANTYISTYSSCPFVLDEFALKYESRFPSITEECLGYNASIMKFLRNIKIDSIFYTQKSSTPYVSPLTDSNRADLNIRILSSLRKLEQFNSNLIFIGITPEYLPPNTVVSRLTSRIGSFHINPSIDNNYWKNKKIYSRARYVDVYSLFCDGATDCIDSINNQSLFVDNHHLSKKGSDYIKLKISEALNSQDFG